MDLDFSPYVLVPFEPAHEKGLIALLEGCYAGYGQVVELDTLDADLLRIASLYAGVGHTFRVLLDGERLIGSVGVKRAVADVAELKRLFLDADYRGRGLGKRLTLWAFDWARRHGYTSMRFWSDTLYETAHALYRHLGALETGERRVLGGRNDVEEKSFVMGLRDLPEIDAGPR